MPLLDKLNQPHDLSVEELMLERLISDYKFPIELLSNQEIKTLKRNAYNILDDLNTGKINKSTLKLIFGSIAKTENFTEAKHKEFALNIFMKGIDPVTAMQEELPIEYLIRALKIREKMDDYEKKEFNVMDIYDYLERVNFEERDTAA